MDSSQNTKRLLLRNSTIKTRFTARFLVSLSKINRIPKVNRLVQSNSPEEIRKRSRRIKNASYSSMAHAVGSRRAWSRALLFKLRNRARTNRFGVPAKRKAVHKAGLLRRLVPGGDKMDSCGLLEETAHYIKCLSTQVKVMQSIMDHCSM